MSINFDNYGAFDELKKGKSRYKRPEDAFLKPSKRKRNFATDSALKEAGSQLGEIQKSANQARKEGTGPSLTQTRQQTEGTLEQFMLAADKVNGQEPTGGAQNYPGRDRLRAEAEAMLDPETGTFSKQNLEILKDQLKRHKEAGIPITSVKSRADLESMQGGAKDVPLTQAPGLLLGDAYKSELAGVTSAMTGLEFDKVKGIVDQSVPGKILDTGGQLIAGAPLGAAQVAEGLGTAKNFNEALNAAVPVDLARKVFDPSADPVERGVGVVAILGTLFAAKHMMGKESFNPDNPRHVDSALAEVPAKERDVFQEVLDRRQQILNDLKAKEGVETPGQGVIDTSKLQPDTRVDRSAFTEDLKSQETPMVTEPGPKFVTEEAPIVQGFTSETNLKDWPKEAYLPSQVLDHKRGLKVGDDATLIVSQDASGRPTRAPVRIIDVGEHNGEPAAIVVMPDGSQRVVNWVDFGDLRRTEGAIDASLNRNTPKATQVTENREGLDVGNSRTDAVNWSSGVPYDKNGKPFAFDKETGANALAAQSGLRTALATAVSEYKKGNPAYPEAKVTRLIDQINELIDAAESQGFDVPERLSHSKFGVRPTETTVETPAGARETLPSPFNSNSVEAVKSVGGLTPGRTGQPDNAGTVPGAGDGNALNAVNVTGESNGLGRVNDVGRSEVSGADVPSRNQSEGNGGDGLPRQQDSVQTEMPTGRDSGTVDRNATGLANQVQPREGISQADTAKERSDLGLEPYTRTRYKVSEYSQEAITRGHDKNALAIADQVNDGKKTSADRFEQEGLRMGKHQAKVRMAEAERLKSDAVESDDAYTIAMADSARQTALNEFDRISKALDKVGSEAGGTLGARAYDLIDEGDSLTLRQKVQSEAGVKVSEAQQRVLDEAAAKVKALQDRVAQLESQSLPAAASRALSSPRAARATRVSKEQAKAAVDTLLTVVKPNGAGAGLGGFSVDWTDAHQDALRTLVRYLVQSGEDSLDKVSAAVKKHLGYDPGDDNIARAVVDEMGRPRAVGRDVLKARAQENAARRQARQVVDQMVRDAKWQQKTNAQKAWTHIGSVFSTPRRLMTFLDDSAIGRQGLRLAASHPKAAAKAFLHHWEALKKEGFDSVMGRLETDPDHDLFKGAGGYLSDPRAGIREEGFLPNFLDKIPGLNVAMAKSEDLMAAYLNELRLESFKALKNGLEIGGHQATTKELQWAAEMVNTASGRGGQLLGGADNIANHLFFSPQMLKARLKLATGTPVVAGFRASNRAGGLALAEYAKYAGARAVLTTLLAGVGFKTSFDLRDREFGKSRRGKMVLDTSGGEDPAEKLVWGNIAQGVGNAVAIAQKRKPDTSKFGEDVFSDVGSFFGKRTAPVASYAKGFIDNKDFKGDPFNPGEEAAKLVLPINFVNIAENLRKNGASRPEAAAMAVLEAFGFSTGYYEKKSSKRRSRRL